MSCWGLESLLWNTKQSWTNKTYFNLDDIFKYEVFNSVILDKLIIEKIIIDLLTEYIFYNLTVNHEPLTDWF